MGFHKLLRKSSCYRWISQAFQIIQLLSMDFTSFPDNPAVIDGFLKLPRQSRCYRWISQAFQTIQVLSMDFSSFTDNPGVIDGFLKLPRQSSCYRWISQASQRIQLLSMDFSNFPWAPSVIVVSLTLNVLIFIWVVIRIDFIFKTFTMTVSYWMFIVINTLPSHIREIFEKI